MNKSSIFDNVYSRTSKLGHQISSEDLKKIGFDEYARWHADEDYRKLDQLFLNDFRKRFVFYSEGMAYFSKGYRAEFKQFEKRDSTHKDILEIWGLEHLEISPVNNLESYIDPLKGFIIPTETIDPELAKMREYTFQIQTATGAKKSKFFEIEKGLYSFINNNIYPIILSSDLRNYEDRSPSIILKRLNIKKMQSSDADKKTLISNIIDAAFPRNFISRDILSDEHKKQSGEKGLSIFDLIQEKTKEYHVEI